VKRRHRGGRSAGSRPALLVALIERAGLRRTSRPHEEPAPADEPVAAEAPPEPIETRAPERPVATQVPEGPRRTLARAAQRVAKPRPQTEPPGPPPREWNLWELERLARKQAGNADRAEEWMALFVHLRVFATADGVLPKEFDRLVRESFGQLIEAA
jgi:hypothetical protein